jgi:Flp pilus assembly CpaF family ATPase
MRIWYNNIVEDDRHAYDVVGRRVRIGRDAKCDIVLNNPHVAPEAAVITQRGGEWELVAAMTGIEVDDRPLRNGDKVVLAGGQSVRIFPFHLTVDLPNKPVDDVDQRRAARDRDLSKFVRLLHVEMLSKMRLEADSSARQQTDDELLVLERALEEIARIKGLLDPKRAGLVAHIAGHAVRFELLNELIATAGGATAPALAGDQWGRLLTAIPDREQELKTVVRRAAADLSCLPTLDLTLQIERVERGFWAAWETILSADLQEAFRQYLALRHLKKEVKDTIFGYGPLQDLIRSPIISEIMVVDRDHIYIEKGGVLENSGRRFVSDEVTEAIIQRIVGRVDRRIDRARPLVDARLTDGSRVNAVIPPLALSGPCLTIRKFPQRKLLIDDLIDKGSLTSTVAEFLGAAVVNRRNILVSGGTGTGKTTLLNCLADFIPEKERIITIEDTAELRLPKEHWVRLETREANAEGSPAYTIRDLVRNALRMRPDRIIVGECRGGEALDMLQAMNTGHDGSMTTVHANSAADVILRLEVLVQMAAPLPIDSIHRQIGSAIDLIVQINRLPGGVRAVTQVTEVTGTDLATGEVVTRDLFVREWERPHAELEPTGRLPTFMGELIDSGAIQLDRFYL